MTVKKTWSDTMDNMISVTPVTVPNYLNVQSHFCQISQHPTVLWHPQYFLLNNLDTYSHHTIQMHSIIIGSVIYFQCAFLSTPLPSDNFCMKYEMHVLCLASLDATRMRKYLTDTASIHVPRFHFLAWIIRVIQFAPYDCVPPSITTSCLSNSSLCNGIQIIMETTLSCISMACDMNGKRWANHYGVDYMRYQIIGSIKCTSSVGSVHVFDYN